MVALSSGPASELPNLAPNRPRCASGVHAVPGVSNIMVLLDGCQYVPTFVSLWRIINPSRFTVDPVVSELVAPCYQYVGTPTSGFLLPTRTSLLLFMWRDRMNGSRTLSSTTCGMSNEGWGGRLGLIISPEIYPPSYERLEAVGSMYSADGPVGPTHYWVVIIWQHVFMSWLHTKESYGRLRDTTSPPGHDEFT